MIERRNLFNFINILLIIVAFIRAEKAEIGDFEKPTDCGTSATNWKPCIERRIADQVFTSCCEHSVPPECRGLCIYETFPIEARVILMQSVQPSRCRLYKYLSSIVNCAAQTHDNSACCIEMGVNEVGNNCLNMCRSQPKPPPIWGVKTLFKDYVQCLSKWDQIMTCHQSGLRARKIQKNKP